MMRKYIITCCLLITPALIFAQEAGNHVTTNQYNIDRLWLLVCAALVFFMQAGFLALEVGLVKDLQATSVALKNVIDFVVGSIAFYLVGFGIMFGHSTTGFFGQDLFVLSGIEASQGGLDLGKTFFLFQLAFSGAAITIVSGALAGRVGFISYLVASFVIGVMIYPVFGHWVWGNSFFQSNHPWLAELGFMDFAGSTVVHSVGGWIALSAAFVIGPRLGRYTADGKLRAIKPSNIGYSILGVFILWLGWYGFNGGSILALDGRVDDIITNTTLAGSAGALFGFAHCFFFQKKEDIYEKFIGGLLGGLVAVTGSCNILSVQAAIAMGAIAGVVHNYAFDFVGRKLKIDDPVGAIPVHGFCGLLGTLLLPWLASQSALNLPRLQQFGVQCLGALAAFVWAAGLGYAVFMVVKKIFGLRVSPAEERAGVSIPGLLQEEPDEDNGQELNEDMLAELMGGK